MDTTLRDTLHHLQEFGTVTYLSDGTILEEGTYDFFSEVPGYHISGTLVLIAFIRHGVPRNFQAVQITQLPGKGQYLVEFGTTDV